MAMQKSEQIRSMIPVREPKPVTLAHVERALDRLAVIMNNNPSIAPGLVPLSDFFEEEAVRLRTESASLVSAAS